MHRCYKDVPTGQFFQLEDGKPRDLFIRLSRHHFSGFRVPAGVRTIFRLIDAAKGNILRVKERVEVEFHHATPVRLLPLSLFFSSPPKVLVLSKEGKEIGKFEYELDENKQLMEQLSNAPAQYVAYA